MVSQPQLLTLASTGFPPGQSSRKPPIPVKPGNLFDEIGLQFHIQPVRGHLCCELIPVILYLKPQACQDIGHLPFRDVGSQQLVAANRRKGNHFGFGDRGRNGDHTLADLAAGKFHQELCSPIHGSSHTLRIQPLFIPGRCFGTESEIAAGSPDIRPMENRSFQQDVSGVKGNL